jgi:hypothetical protein
MVTTPMGPEFVKNTGQSGAKSGDHTQTVAETMLATSNAPTNNDSATPAIDSTAALTVNR